MLIISSLYLELCFKKRRSLTHSLESRNDHSKHLNKKKVGSFHYLSVDAWNFSNGESVVLTLRQKGKKKVEWCTWLDNSKRNSHSHGQSNLVQVQRQFIGNRFQQMMLEQLNSHL